MTPVTLVTLGPEHLDDAAALLASRHGRNRTLEPALPGRYGDVAGARLLLAALRDTPGASGVAALTGGRLTGYLLGTRLLAEPYSYTKLYRPPRQFAIEPAGYGIAPTASITLLRDLFAELAEDAVRDGYFACSVSVPATEPETLRVWRSLGFGLDLTLGIRDLTPVAPAALSPGVQIRRAVAADTETVARMVAANDRHHARPPLFLPALPENLWVQRAVHAPLLADERNAVFLAEREGAPLGLHSYTPDEPDLMRDARAIYLQDAYVAPEARGQGLSRALLAEGLRWAAGIEPPGFTRCTVAWNTANLLGARFWHAAGFRPLLHRLRRDVDTR